MKKKPFGNVQLRFCSCGEHGRLQVNGAVLPTACSKEQLLAQMTGLLRTGELSFQRFDQLAPEVLMSSVASTDAEAAERAEEELAEFINGIDRRFPGLFLSAGTMLIRVG